MCPTGRLSIFSLIEIVQYSVSVAIKHIPIKHCNCNSNIPIVRRKCVEVVKKASSRILSTEHFNEKQKILFDNFDSQVRS